MDWTKNSLEVGSWVFVTLINKQRNKIDYPGTKDDTQPVLSTWNLEKWEMKNWEIKEKTVIEGRETRKQQYWEYCMWDAAKAVMRVKFIDLNNCIIK